VEYETLQAMTRLFQIKHGFLRKLIPHDFLVRAKAIEDFPMIDLPSSVKPFEKGYDLLKDGSLLGVPLCGHTVGQVGLFFRSMKGEVLLVADAVWHSNSYRSLVKPHFLTRLLTSDSDLYWKTVLDLNQAHTSNPELFILPSHCPENHSSFL
jgi:glyoxylase-like metal-dependent hydrolase (beta-lactamase superfamily II)